MKHLLLILSIFSLTTNSMASAGATHFVCGYSQQYNNLSVQFDGPRFVDSLNFGLTKDEIQELLFEGEKGLDAHSGKIYGFLTMGSCKKGSFDTLVSCHQDNAFLSYTFSHTEELSNEHSQNITYNRNLEIKDISLVVKDINGNAHLDLNMTFSHFTAEDVEMHISRNLGKIANTFGSCKYTGVGL